VRHIKLKKKEKGRGPKAGRQKLSARRPPGRAPPHEEQPARYFPKTTEEETSSKCTFYS